MKYSTTFVPGIDQVTRALNLISSNTGRAVRDHDDRLVTLEARENPFFTHDLDVYSTAQSFACSGSYGDFHTMTVDWDNGVGDSFFILGIVTLVPAAGNEYEMQLLSVSDYLGSVPVIAGDGTCTITVPLIAVDKPDGSKSLNYKMQLRRTSGADNVNYTMKGLFVLRGWS